MSVLMARIIMTESKNLLGVWVDCVAVLQLNLTFQNKYVLYDHAEFMNCVIVVILRVC